MKKKTGELSDFLPPTTLYLNDINDLNAILAKSTQGIRVETTDFELEDISELTKLGTRRLKFLQFYTREPTVVVIFRSRAVQLFAMKDDTISRGIIDEVKAFFAKRRRPLARIFPGFAGLVPISFLGTALTLIAIQIKSRTLSLALSALAIAISLYVLLGFFTLLRGNTLILASRGDVRSWWERNRDALLVGTMTGIVGVVIGGLIVFFLTRQH